MKASEVFNLISDAVQSYPSYDKDSHQQQVTNDTLIIAWEYNRVTIGVIITYDELTDMVTIKSDAPTIGVLVSSIDDIEKISRQLHELSRHLIKQ